MTLSTLKSDDRHQQVLLLLPWYLNHSLDAGELRLVEEHIRGCMLCRGELKRLERLASAVKRASDLDVAADISFDGLREQLKSSRPVSRLGSLSPPHGAAGQGMRHKKNAGRQSFGGIRIDRWLGFALAASLLLAFVPLVMRTDLAAVDYRTLADAKLESGGGTKLRVVFKKMLPDDEIDGLLARIHSRRLEGPNSLGAYTVQLGSDADTPSMSAALDFLRSQQNVMLAEPVLN